MNRAEALQSIKSMLTQAQWDAAAQVLKATPTSDGKPRGSCVYPVVGSPQQLCVDGVSQAECLALKGTWTAGQVYAQAGPHDPQL